MPTPSRFLATALAGLWLAAAALVVSPGPASALSCVDQQAIYDGGEQAYTGRIVDAKDGTIEVAVDEIWKGGPVAEKVQLRTELDGWWDWIDGGQMPDSYHSETPWLFVPRTTEKGTQVVSPCSAWTTEGEWATHLTAPAVVTHPATAEQESVRRSATARTPEDGSNLLVRGGAAALALCAAGAVILVVRRRRG